MPSPRFHPFVRLLLCVVGTLVLAVVVALVVETALQTAARMTRQPALDLTGFLKRNPLLAMLLFYPPALAWLWFCRRAFDRRSFVSFGFAARDSGRGMAMGALCGALAISFLFGLLWVTGNVRINGPSPESFAIGPFATLSVLVFYALMFFAVGFMEEVTFRGYALHNLAAWSGIRFAVVVQAVVFALVHLGNVAPEGGAASAGGGTMRVLSETFWDARWAMLNIALIGWFFALCYLKTGSLWFPIGFHAAWNFCLGCIFSLPVSGLKVFRLLDVSVSSNAVVTGGGFGAEGSLFLPAITGAMIWMLYQHPDHPQARHDLALLCPSEAAAQNVSSAVESESPPDYAPSRFKTSMRPAERPGDAPRFPSDGFSSDMSTHVAAQGGFSSALPDVPDDVPDDDPLRIDVSSVSPPESKAISDVPQTFATRDARSDATRSEIAARNDAAPIGRTDAVEATSSAVQAEAEQMAARLPDDLAPLIETPSHETPSHETPSHETARLTAPKAASGVTIPSFPVRPPHGALQDDAVEVDSSQAPARDASVSDASASDEPFAARAPEKKPAPRW